MRPIRDDLCDARDLEDVIEVLRVHDAPDDAYRVIAGGLAYDSAFLADGPAVQAAAAGSIAFARGNLWAAKLDQLHRDVLANLIRSKSLAARHASRAACISTDRSTYGAHLAKMTANVVEAARQAGGWNAPTAIRAHFADVARAVLSHEVLCVVAGTEEFQTGLNEGHVDNRRRFVPGSTRSAA